MTADDDERNEYHCYLDPVPERLRFARAQKRDDREKQHRAKLKELDQAIKEVERQIPPESLLRLVERLKALGEKDPRATAGSIVETKA